MALEGLKRQLRSVIEWSNPDDNDLIYCWSENGDEIKNSSKLIVGPGQGCIFVYRGKIKDIIETGGVYNLQTENVPFWTTVSRVLQFFESEHKTGFYFYKKTKIMDQKWGTSSPIVYEDPKYKFPVGLKAYGNFSFMINDVKTFFKNVVGDRSSYYIDDFTKVMKNRLVQPFTDLMAETKYSYAELDANLNEISEEITEQLVNDFDKLGFTIVDFRVEGTDFDEDTKKRIDRIADIKAEMHAAKAAGISYQELQKVEAMRDAAKNEGGGAGVGMSMGAGIGFGEMLSDVTKEVPHTRKVSVEKAPEKKASVEEAPVEKVLEKKAQAEVAPTEKVVAKKEEVSEDLVMARLKKLKILFKEELISEDEYKAKKTEILSEL